MTTRAILQRGGVVLGLLLVGPAVTAAWAASGGDHERSWTITLLGFVNLGIYGYILYRFAWPPIVKYLKERRATVVSALEAAARAHAEAEALKAEFEAKLKNVEAEAARARDELMEIARTEADQLVAQATRSAERIRRDAQLVADQEIARARRVLQEETAGLISKIAGDVVSSQLTDQDQSRFVESFLTHARDDKATGAVS